MPTPKGLRQFLDAEQQQAWLDGEPLPPDADERDQSLELRFKYAGRLAKLLRRPQAGDVLDILRLYGATCLPIPRTTERWYWSVSCLPGSPDKPLARVNASWMELFALHRKGATASAPASSCTSPISHTTARPSPSNSTPTCSKAAQRGPKT
jgi:hypothetical protein